MHLTFGVRATIACLTPHRGQVVPWDFFHVQHCAGLAAWGAICPRGLCWRLAVCSGLQASCSLRLKALNRMSMRRGVLQRLRRAGLLALVNVPNSAKCVAMGIVLKKLVISVGLDMTL
ncbi:hypothetical protein TRVL_07029 [Trypanosoma vivax]|nr:hypothetical protein TRVL_07029 [Trypanosoma vivax]